jgi:hypothetical protein
METMKTIVVGEVMLDHMVQGEWDGGPYHDPSNMAEYCHYNSSWIREYCETSRPICHWRTIKELVFEYCEARWLFVAWELEFGLHMYIVCHFVEHMLCGPIIVYRATWIKQITNEPCQNFSFVSVKCKKPVRVTSLPATFGGLQASSTCYSWSLPPPWCLGGVFVELSVKIVEKSWWWLWGVRVYLAGATKATLVESRYWAVPCPLAQRSIHILIKEQV